MKKEIITVKKLLKDDMFDVKNNIKHIIIGLILWIIIILALGFSFPFVAFLILIIGFMRTFSTLLLFLKWFCYWARILYRVHKYWKRIEKYNFENEGIIWGNLTLKTFLLKEFHNPEIIYDCMDGEKICNWYNHK